MRIIVTESQLLNIVRRQKKKKEMKEVDAMTTSTPTSSSSPASTTSSGEPQGKGADDFPAYPEVDRAEDLVKRGVGNPVDYTKKHEDYPEANPVRGRANPIKGM